MRPTRTAAQLLREPGIYWAPMVAPPLPCRNDREFDTCRHAFPVEECVQCWIAAEVVKLREQVFEDTWRVLRHEMFPWLDEEPPTDVN